jgi:hypothetical protein
MVLRKPCLPDELMSVLRRSLPTGVAEEETMITGLDERPAIPEDVHENRTARSSIETQSARDDSSSVRIPIPCPAGRATSPRRDAKRSRHQFPFSPRLPSVWSSACLTSMERRLASRYPSARRSAGTCTCAMWVRVSGTGSGSTDRGILCKATAAIQPSGCSIRTPARSRGRCNGPTRYSTTVSDARMFTPFTTVQFLKRS